MAFSNSFIKMSLERKEELRDMAIYVNRVVMECFNVNFYKKDSYHPSASQKIDNAYSYFKKIYNSELTDDERNIFNLYILFPDDEYFNSFIVRYNKDYEKIATFFNVNPAIVKLRYLLQKNIAAERQYEDNEEEKTMI